MIYLDADDYLVAGSLPQLLSALEDTNCDILMYDYQTRTYDGILVKELVYSNNTSKIRTGEDFLTNEEVTWVPWLTAFNRTFLINNNLKFAEKVRFEDTDYMLKAFLLASSVTYRNITVVCHIINPASTVFIGKDIRKINEQFLTSDRLTKTIIDYRKTLPTGTKVLEAHQHFHYSALVKRTLWRIRYKDIVKILKEHPYQLETKDKLLLLTRNNPQIYAAFAQVVRPLLLAAVKFRNKLRRH